MDKNHEKKKTVLIGVIISLSFLAVFAVLTVIWYFVPIQFPRVLKAKFFNFIPWILWTGVLMWLLMSAGELVRFKDLNGSTRHF